MRRSKPDVDKLFSEVDVEGLIQVLSYCEDSEVRSDAAIALGKLGNARAVEPLIRAFIDPSDTVRESVRWALVKLGDLSVEPLIKVLENGAVKGRSISARVLGVLRDLRKEESISRWIQDVLCHERDVRVQSAKVLGNLRDERSLEPLLRVLADKNIFLRRYVYSALGGLGDASAVEPLVEAMKDDDACVRTAARDALVKLGAHEPLIKALKDGEDSNYWDNVRWTAEQNMPDSADVRAVELMIKVLEEEHDSSLREYACWALGRAGDGNAVEPLIKALEDSSPSVRASAAVALGKMTGSPRVVEALAMALGDNASGVRVAAAKALGKMSSSASVEEALIGALRDRDPDVRASVVWSLGEMEPSTRIVEALSKALSDDDELFRNKVSEALEELSPVGQRKKKCFWNLFEIPDGYSENNELLIGALNS